MTSKKCFICNQEKLLSDFYKHSRMLDGHLNKCKNCTKNYIKNRYHNLIKDPIYKSTEKERHRLKYYRLGYKDKYKPTTDKKKIILQNYISKYPEKYKASIKLANKFKIEGYHRHHWSYNEEHYEDIIHLTPTHHAEAHRYILYDQERMMYRRIDTMELLDTKEKHLQYINNL